MWEVQACGVDARLMQHRCVKVANVDRGFGHVVAEVKRQSEWRRGDEPQQHACPDSNLIPYEAESFLNSSIMPCGMANDSSSEVRRRACSNGPARRQSTRQCPRTITRMPVSRLSSPSNRHASRICKVGEVANSQAATASADAIPGVE